MALFTDGNPSTIEDLRWYESSLLEVARVESLEASLGLKLFERGQTGSRLTEAGRDLLVEAERVEQASLAFSSRAASQTSPQRSQNSTASTRVPLVSFSIGQLLRIDIRKYIEGRRYPSSTPAYPTAASTVESTWACARLEFARNNGAMI